MSVQDTLDMLYKKAKEDFSTRLKMTAICIKFRM